ncbi:MAG: CBS domain-containing protein [Chitinophagales bacterium]|nr:CBS domain-containing protein [Chitinophagales bacterium]
MRNTSVQNIMSRKVVIAKKENTLFQVKELYLKFNIHHLPVVNEKEQLIGIISTSDLLRFYAKQLPSKAEVEVETLEKFFRIDDVMTKNPISLDIESTVRDAAELFAINKFHALPIVKDRKIMGIVTSNDLLQYLINDILME